MLQSYTREKTSGSAKKYHQSIRKIPRPSIEQRIRPPKRIIDLPILRGKMIKREPMMTRAGNRISRG